MYTSFDGFVKRRLKMNVTKRERDEHLFLDNFLMFLNWIRFDIKMLTQLPKTVDSPSSIRQK